MADGDQKPKETQEFPRIEREMAHIDHLVSEVVREGGRGVDEGEKLVIEKILVSGYGGIKRMVEAVADEDEVKIREAVKAWVEGREVEGLGLGVVRFGAEAEGEKEVEWLGKRVAVRGEFGDMNPKSNRAKLSEEGGKWTVWVDEGLVDGPGEVLMKELVHEWVAWQLMVKYGYSKGLGEVSVGGPINVIADLAVWKWLEREVLDRRNRALGDGV